MNINKLYNRVLNKEISEYAFIQEMSKYPQYSKYRINNFPTLIKTLKRDRILISENVEIVQPQLSTVKRLDFNNPIPKEIHIISVSPNSFEYICNDKHRKVAGEDFKSFIDTMYKDLDDDPNDNDDLSKASEFILHNQDSIDDYPTVSDNYSVQDLDEMKRSALKVVSPKPIATQLNESDYDLVSSHSFSLGFPIEFDKLKDVQKAKDKVVKNLLKNPSYYIELLTGKKVDTSNGYTKYSKDNLVDKKNASKIIKVLNENDSILGGIGDNKPDNAFDMNQLRIGTKVEMKHTKDVNKAKEIAKDNLTKDANYYVKLKRIGLLEFEDFVGGLGDNKLDTDFDPIKLSKAVAKEKEHSSDENQAKEIAKDHLSIDPDYYEKLDQVGLEEYKTRLKEEVAKYLKETGKPSSGLSAKEKSDIVKKAKAGKDFGKKGAGFEKIVKNAEKSGYAEKTAQKIAGASFWKNLKR